MLKKLTLRERLSGLVNVPGAGVTAIEDRPQARTGFFGAHALPFILRLNPTLRQPNDEWREAWIRGTQLAVDAIQQSGFLTGGVEQATIAMVGPGLALNARPDATFLGGEASATTWARDIERRWEAYSGNGWNCDFYGKQTLDQLVALAVKQWFGYGEIFGLTRYKPRPGSSAGTKLQIIPPTRCSHSATRPDAVQGVVHDEDGVPVAYVFNAVDRQGNITGVENVVQKRDRFGRPVVTHVHDAPTTVVRGLTPLMPALRVIKQYDELANAALTNVLIHAIFAATIESEAPTEHLLDALQGYAEQNTSDPALQTPSLIERLLGAMSGWHEGTKVDLGRHGKFMHLFPSEKMKFHNPQGPATELQAFIRFLLREVARCLGITYEQFTGDREGATYSSERMGSSEAWLITGYRRRHIAAPLYQATYEGWLEELILTDAIQVPDGIQAFRANRDAISRASWRGPAKPQADELKSAKASEIKLLNRIITREMWCAEEGVDWQDVDDQLMREYASEQRPGMPPKPAPETGDGGFEDGEEKQAARGRLTRAILSGDEAAIDAALVGL